MEKQNAETERKRERVPSFPTAENQMESQKRNCNCRCIVVVVGSRSTVLLSFRYVPMGSNPNGRACIALQVYLFCSV